MRLSRFIQRFLANVFAYGTAMVFLVPFVWLVFSSFKPEAELFSWPPKIWSSPTLENYIKILKNSELKTFLLNSTIVASSATVLTVFISTIAGYALAKYKFGPRRFLELYIMATLMVPLQISIVPLYLVIYRLGLINTYWGLIIPPAATPTGILLSQRYIASAIPDELIESARIDGAGELLIFWKVVFPLCWPLIAALSILSFTWRWNDFLWPLIVVGKPQLFTIQLALGMYVGEHIVQWGAILAMTVIAMLPIIAVFIFLQRYFISGVVTGAIK